LSILFDTTFGITSYQAKPGLQRVLSPHRVEIVIRGFTAWFHFLDLRLVFALPDKFFALVTKFPPTKNTRCQDSRNSIL
jgi:hypothetical protein